MFHADALNLLAEIEREEGETERAVEAATRAYEKAWCDGPPFAYHWGLERAKGLGADVTINPQEDDAAKTIRHALGRGGVDLALEFVGRAATVELAIRCLDKAGRAVVVGVGIEKPTLPRLIGFVGREQAVLGSFGMDRADIADLYTLIATGRLDLSASISARYPLAEANAALQR